MINLTLAEVARESNVMLALSQFLDDFRISSNKRLLIKDRPSSDSATAVELCLMAAVAHKLAVDNNLDVPSWVHGKEYTMPQPVYAHETTDEDYRHYLIETTPGEFASKNLYYGINVMERV